MTAASELIGPSDQHPDRLPTFHARESTIPTTRQNTGENGITIKGNYHRASSSRGSSLVLQHSVSSVKLQQLHLQSEEEQLAKRSSQAPHEGGTSKTKKNIGKMKVQGFLSVILPGE